MNHNKKIKDRYEQIMAALNFSDRQIRIIEQLEQGYRPRKIQKNLGLSQKQYQSSLCLMFKNTGLNEKNISLEKRIDMLTDIKKDSIKYIQAETKKQKEYILMRKEKFAPKRKMIFEEMLKGSMPKDISKQLNTTEVAVRTAMTHIYNAMGINVKRGSKAKRRIFNIVTKIIEA